MSATRNRPTHDLVVFGATSFVGQILTRYLTEEFGTHDGLRWAIAGRSETKLAALRNGRDGAPLAEDVLAARSDPWNPFFHAR